MECLTALLVGTCMWSGMNIAYPFLVYFSLEYVLTKTTNNSDLDHLTTAYNNLSGLCLFPIMFYHCTYSLDLEFRLIV